MYCPKCNLHSEEYVDKCPLCDGPMEVDEVASGVMKTPPVPEDGGTEEIPLQEAIKLEEDLEDQETVAFDQELLDEEAADIETLEGVEDLDASQSGELGSDLEEPDYGSGPPPEIPFEPEKPGASKRPLFLGLLLLIVLLVGGGYYFYAYAPQSPDLLEKAKEMIAGLKEAPPADVPMETGETAEKEAEATEPVLVRPEMM